MADLVERANRALEDEVGGAPALARCLSPLGRRLAMPRDIPVQAQDARGKTYNGTIGQITDGAGGALPLPSLAAGLSGLSAEVRNRALLYSPVSGLPAVRDAWRRWQRKDLKTAGLTDVPSTLPLVVDGLTHGLSVVADLFAGEGRVVVTPEPFWGNYRQTFGTRTGARLVGAESFRDGAFRPEVAEEALEGVPMEDGEPVVAILNFPSNPGGYSPTDEERRRLVASYERLAEARPVVVLCDDAYAGLVYEEPVSRRSLFWDLAGRHPNLTPVKVDGATKELSFFGGRVGFVTFPFEPGSPAAEALESKVCGLLRATVGSPVAVSQALVQEALASPSLADEVERVRLTLERRYRRLREALEDVDRELLRPRAFNSGCFALLELPEGLAPERVRRHLLDHHDTGVVSLGGRFLRIAYCSVAAEALPELVRRIEAGVRELAGATT